MEPYADLSCILKVNVHCEACKMKIVEVLSSVIGVYSVDIDAREGMAKVSGEVDPNVLLKALARTGKHAELAWVKLKHPMLNRDREHYTSSYHNNHGSYGDYHNNYNYEPHPHGNYSRYKRGLHGGHSSWYDSNNNYYRGQYHNYYPTRRPMPAAHHQYPPDYYHQDHHHHNYGYMHGPFGSMPTTSSHRYPPHMYSSFVDDPNYSSCSIM